MINDAAKTEGMEIKHSNGLNIYLESGKIILPGIGWRTNPTSNPVSSLYCTPSAKPRIFTYMFI
jgi:hypothetical protein